MATDYRPYQIHSNPVKTTSKLSGFNTADWLFTAGYFLVVVIMLSLLGSLSLVVAAPYFGLMRRMEHGRMYAWPSRRRPRRTTVWEYQDKRPSRLSKKRQLPVEEATDDDHWDGSKRELIPFRVEGITDPMTGDDIGLLHFSRLGIDAIVITGTGSDIVAKRIEEQYDRTQGIATTIKELASIPDHSVGISFFFRRGPHDSGAYSEMLAGNVHPEILYPGYLERDDEQPYTTFDKRIANLRQILDEDEAIAHEMSNEVTMAMVVSIRRSEKLASASRKNQLRAEDAKRLPIRQIAQAAIDGLTDESVQGLQVLTTDQVQDFVREGWDYVDQAGYYERSIARSHDDADRLANGRPIPDRKPIHWPQRSIRQHADYLQVDGTWWTFVKLTASPKSPLPNELRRLFSIDVPAVTVVNVGEAVSSNREYLALNLLIPIKADIEAAIGRDYKGPKSLRSDAEREERNQQITDSSFSMSYMVIVGIPADSQAAMEDAFTTVERTARSYEMRPTRLVGKYLQVPALWTVVTGVNLL